MSLFCVDTSGSMLQGKKTEKFLKREGVQSWVVR